MMTKDLHTEPGSSPLREALIGLHIEAHPLDKHYAVMAEITPDGADAILSALSSRPEGLGSSLRDTHRAPEAGVVEPPLREHLEYARDLLMERRYGSPARSPGHNARLVIEAALSLLPAAPDTASPLDILIDDAFGKMKPFCKACQAIPKHGYCNMQGCPMPRPQQPVDGRLTPEKDANHQDNGGAASPAEQGGEK